MAYQSGSTGWSKLFGRARHAVGVAKKVTAATKGFLYKAIGSQTNLKIVLIGETGSGKTSFLNLLLNFGQLKDSRVQFDEHTIKDFKPYNIEDAENCRSKSMESKTSEALVYDIALAEGCSLRIIDTPGFGDTRGIEEDKKHAEKIVRTLEGQEFIHCICLVINGRNSRMSPNLEYVLNEISGILPKDVMNNVVVIFTNTSDPMDLSFDYTVLADYFGRSLDSALFFVDNPFCKCQKAMEKNVAVPLIVKSINKAVPDTVDTLQSLFTKVKDFEVVHTHQFTHLYDKKQEVELKVMTLLTAYDQLRREERALKKAAADMDSVKEELETNRDFQTVEVVVKVVESTQYNILCGAKDCCSTCHEKCLLPKFFGKKAIKLCEKFKDGDCQECGHSYEHHSYNKGHFERQTTVDSEMKRRYTEAKTLEDKKILLHKTCKEKKEKSEKKRKELSDQLLHTIQEYEKMGSAHSYKKILKNQLAVIEQRLQGSVEAETADLEKTRNELQKMLQVVKTVDSKQRSSVK